MHLFEIKFSFESEKINEKYYNQINNALFYFESHFLEYFNLYCIYNEENIIPIYEMKTN